jgi:hypothetical protein
MLKHFFVHELEKKCTGQQQDCLKLVKINAFTFLTVQQIPARNPEGTNR